jgi:hypothetical protein
MNNAMHKIKVASIEAKAAEPDNPVRNGLPIFHEFRRIDIKQGSHISKVSTTWQNKPG